LQAGKIAHAKFNLLGQEFILMDSGLFHDHTFTEGISLVIECQDQDEIDHYWNELSRGGSEGKCGWLKDTFGLSWQVVPAILPELMSDPEKAEGVMRAFRQMTKFEINKLLQDK
jgi:predicted 3-demethylubiquinone-9 3-methyltransferase (glyoxalase superfamily)